MKSFKTVFLRNRKANYLEYTIGALGHLISIDDTRLTLTYFMENIIEVYIKGIVLQFGTNGRSVKGILLTSKFCTDVVSVSCFGVRVSVMFHFMFVHYTLSSVWVAEWPPFGK